MATGAIPTTSRPLNRGPSRLETTPHIPVIMKTRILLFSCGAAALAMFAFWSGEATAQSGPAAEGPSSYDIPLKVQCIVTLDPRSNSRSTMTAEMHLLSGFVRPDTVQGLVIQSNPQWLVLKDGDSENWVPRDKILMVRLQR